MTPIIEKCLREKLFDIMSDISEEHYCASWLIGLEHSLWQAALGTDNDWRYGLGRIEPASLEMLRALSKELNGWQTFERFVPMDEWLKIYDENESQAYAIPREADRVSH